MSDARRSEERALRRIPIHRSLVRPVLYAGCERESIGTLAIVCFATAVGSGFTSYALILSVTIFLVGLAVLQRLSKNDPDIRLVLVRYFWFDREYAHASEEDAEPRPIHPSVPTSA